MTYLKSVSWPLGFYLCQTLFDMQVYQGCHQFFLGTQSLGFGMEPPRSTDMRPEIFSNVMT